MTLLTVVVPAYNAAAYLERALAGITDLPDVEVIVVDDGSTDTTADLAQARAAASAGRVRVIRQLNAGHGGAINTGIAAARGTYLRILDADDWLDPVALERTLLTLAHHEDHGGVDVLITNFVYEREGKRPRTMRFDTALPPGGPFTWDAVGRFGRRSYLMMHALTYRTALVREAGLVLPEHTFYVDNLYVLGPLTRSRRLAYLDVDLYRYFIGRADQSVNDAVMLGRVDQQVAVTRQALSGLPRPDDVPASLYRYLLHHVEILCGITSALLARSTEPGRLAQREQFWAELRREAPWVWARVRRGVVGRSANLRGAHGRTITRVVYHVARRVVGFS